MPLHRGDKYAGSTTAAADYVSRRALDLYPVSLTAMQLAHSVAMLSYADDLYFGIPGRLRW